MIEDTSKRDNEIHYLGFTALGADGYIGGMERTGQQSLVVSADLPTKSPNADEEFEALGFTLGEPHKHDPLFRPATLPAGWRKQAKEHAMGSAVVDELGRERVSVFYKAAFYDRRADMHLNTVYGYVMHLEYEKGTPVLDDSWATPEAVAEAARGMIGNAQESIDLYEKRTDEYSVQRVAECRETIAWAEALIARVGA